MFNMFVDKDALAAIHDVAGRLASSTATPAKWASTELGGLVRFTDDRSQDRVRKILSAYTDGSLQDKGVFMKIRKERASFMATYMPKSNKFSHFLSRAMGLASFRLPETMTASNELRRQCEGRFYLLVYVDGTVSSPLLSSRQKPGPDLSAPPFPPSMRTHHVFHPTEVSCHVDR